MKKLFALSLILITSSSIFAQTNNPPALSSIKIEDLKKDLYAHADGHFKGRSAGTLDELKAAAWLAEQYKAIGLKPAGDDGTYFQFFTMWRNHLTDNSTISINNKPYTLWKDAAVAQMANVNINAPILYLGNALNIDTSINVKDRVVAIVADPKGINMQVSLPTWRYSRSVYTKYGLPLVRKGAKAIIFIADETAEKAWDDASENFLRGSYDIDGGPNVNVTSTVPVIWVHANVKKELENNSATLKANLIISKYAYPSVNVVGKIDGTDAKLKS